MSITITEMTAEDIRDICAAEELGAIFLGFENIRELEEFKINAACGMIKFGGSFARPLGEALSHADSNNTAIIIKGFRMMCEEHADLYLKFRENIENDKSD